MFISDKVYVLIYIVTILAIFILLQGDNNQIESFKYNKSFIYGQQKQVQQIRVHPKIPGLPIPLRKQIHTWIVKVPLTPFKAPLLKLPPIQKGEIEPNFLVYNPLKLSPVKNQGDCGACWAFSVAYMLSDRLMIATGGLFNSSISVQQILSCFDPDGCDGGSPEEACLWLARNGKQLELSKYNNYIQESGGYVNSECPKELQGALVGVKPNSVFSIVEYIEEENYDISILNQNIANMKRVLLESGPFYCAMTVYDDLFTFSGTGIYKKQPNAKIVGGHAIEVIGYCNKGIDPRDEFKGSSYWICKNSWGKNWPLNTLMNGYFAIEMGTNMCGIESRCGFASPTLDARFQSSSKHAPLSKLRFTNIHNYLKLN